MLRRRALLFAPTGLLLRSAAARASTIEVAPVISDLQAGQMASVITLTNRGNAAASLQVRAFDWSQPGGQDQLSPTTDLIVSPPIFTLAGDAAQTVRILLRRPATGQERAFRLLIDEIPAVESVQRRVQIAIRFSLPVFAQVADVRPALLEWRLQGRQLTVSNRGGRRMQLVNLSLASPGGGPAELIPPENPYILPGVARRWMLLGAAPRAGSVLRAQAIGEAGPLDAQVTAETG